MDPRREVRNKCKLQFQANSLLLNWIPVWRLSGLGNSGTKIKQFFSLPSPCCCRLLFPHTLPPHVLAFFIPTCPSHSLPVVFLKLRSSCPNLSPHLLTAPKLQWAGLATAGTALAHKGETLFLSLHLWKSCLLCGGQFLLPPPPLLSPPVWPTAIHLPLWLKQDLFPSSCPSPFLSRELCLWICPLPGL